MRESIFKEAIIIINTRALADPLSPGTGPFYDSQAPGYDTVFIKVAEHEIGHGLGLDHPNAQQPGQSVMNQSTTCPNAAPNDACNENPTEITPCDTLLKCKTFIMNRLRRRPHRDRPAEVAAREATVAAARKMEIVATPATATPYYERWDVRDCRCELRLCLPC